MWHYFHDGQQAGPVSREEIQGFLQSQALPVTVLVWTRGMNHWLPANEVPQLIAGVVGGYLPQPVAGAPFVITSPSPNGMAIASLILGVIGVFGALIFTSVPAIICGHIARGQIRKAEGREAGDGLALTGLILGYLVTILSLLLLCFFVWLVWYAYVNAGGVRVSPGSPPPVTVPVTPSP